MHIHVINRNQNSDFATAISNDVNNTTVTATRNILYDVVQPVAVIQPPNTSISPTLTIPNKHFRGFETEFSLETSGQTL